MKFFRPGWLVVVVVAFTVMLAQAPGRQLKLRAEVEGQWGGKPPGEDK